MSGFLDYLIGAAGFMPHGTCLLWRPDLVALHAISDFVIAAAYLAIPAAILAVLRQRAHSGPQTRRVAILFVAFIVACAVTHFASLITLWYPAYGAQGLAKAVTAAISLTTAFLVWRLVPTFAGMPSFEALQESNLALRGEVDTQVRRRDELSAANAELERVAAEKEHELARQAQILKTSLESADITVFCQDADLKYVWVHNSRLAASPEEAIGKSDRDFMPEEKASEMIAVKRAVMEGREGRTIETDLDVNGEARSFRQRIEPQILPDGTVDGVVGVVVDMTHERRAEDAMRIAMREVTHRSKNLLAVIQAIARQTAQDSADVSDFSVRFGDRLRALAAAQDVLVGDSWRGASLDALITSQLGHYAPKESGQLKASGPDISLSAEATQALGMALHELATNAVKYGALSTPDGRVQISWSRSGDGRASGAVIEWVETGGPPVTRPDRAGFGTVVIERNLAHALEAEVALTYEPTGVSARIEIPAKHIVGGAGRNS